MSERKTPVGEAEDPGVLQKKRARRRLIGAVTFAVVTSLVLSFALDREPRPLREDLVLKMPAREAGDSRTVGGSSDREAALAPPPDDGPEPAEAARPSKGDSRPSQSAVSQAASLPPAVAAPPTATPPVVTPPAVTPPAMAAIAGGPSAQGNSNAGAVIDSSVNPPQVITPPSSTLPSVFAPFPDAPPPPPVKSGKVETKAESKPEPKPKPEPKAEKKPEAKPEKRPEPKPEKKPEPKPEKRPEPKPESKRETGAASGSGSGNDADGDDAIAQIAKSRAAQESGASRPAPSGAPAKSGPYRLQVGAFSSVSSAELAIAKLKAAGFSASRETVRGSGGTELIRVRTGSYPDRAAAQRAHDALQSRGVSTTVIAP
jgi:DedD protein